MCIQLVRITCSWMRTGTWWISSIPETWTALQLPSPLCICGREGDSSVWAEWRTSWCGSTAGSPFHHSDHDCKRRNKRKNPQLGRRKNTSLFSLSRSFVRLYRKDKQPYIHSRLWTCAFEKGTMNESLLRYTFPVKSLLVLRLWWYFTANMWSWQDIILPLE